CDGIWWDTLCIPREKAARNIAIRNMQSNYQDARITLVHDCFLRNWEWVDAEAACFAILMSPWFSRGWTALELAKSRKVKVIFKGPSGPLIKDLDEQILAEDTGCPPSTPHERATAILRSLRKGIATLDDLLAVLGPRYTSWPKDIATISGLLVGVDVTPKDAHQDVWQQDIYRTILRKMGKISHRHLFHNSATVSRGSSWYPINLFDMPIADSAPSLQFTEGGDLTGTWKLIRVTNSLRERIVWTGIHPLIKAELQLELESPEKCVMLAECGTETVQVALLAKGMKKVGTTSSICYKYIGGVHFHPALRQDDIGEGDEAWIEMEARVLGDGNGAEELDKKVWDIIKEFAAARGDEKPYHLKIDRAEEGVIMDGSNSMSLNNEADEVTENVDLILAAKAGGEPRSLRHLDMANINCQDEQLWTALHYAIWRGHHTFAKKLIEEANVDANVQDAFGRRPLHLAAERGERAIVLSLLRKVEVDAQSNDGKTALHCAAWAGSTTIVDYLLDAGSNANIVDSVGNTALHAAAEKGFELVVMQLLVDTGADVDVRGQYGLTPLQYAAMNGHEAVVKLLLERKADIDCKDEMVGWTPLHCAAENGHEGIAKLLIESGATVNTKDREVGWTPLHLASMNGNQGLVELLMQNRAEKETTDKKGWTPRRFAEEMRYEKITSLLCDEDVNSNLGGASIDQLTPLHYLAMTGQYPVTKIFVEICANINFKSKNGRDKHDAAEDDEAETDKTQDDVTENDKIEDDETESDVTEDDEMEDVETEDDKSQNNETEYGGTSWIPLLWAAKNGQDAVVKFLLDKGTDVSVEDDVWDQALHCASRSGHDRVVTQLLDKIPDISLKTAGKVAIHTAASNGHAIVVKLLLDKGVDVMARDDDKTPLHYAAENGHKEVVQVLLDRRADINAALKEGWDHYTPLTMAIKNRREAVALQLLNRDASWSGHKIYSRYTALHDAAMEGMEGVVQLILDKGEKVDTKGWEGWTPLHVAAERGHAGVVKVLLRHGADTTSKVWDGFDECDLTALQLAKSRGHMGVVEVLETHSTPAGFSD
ncbi:hypothetical protein V491_03676, partial [Pseudogymnoascus sp. VKM F-3775]